MAFFKVLFPKLTALNYISKAFNLHLNLELSFATHFIIQLSKQQIIKTKLKKF